MGKIIVIDEDGTINVKKNKKTKTHPVFGCLKLSCVLFFLLMVMAAIMSTTT